VWETFRRAQPFWLLAAVFIYVLGYLLRVLRWKILIAPIKEIPSKDLAAPLILGFFANNILPFRMGEFVRAHITGRKFHVSRTGALGTILLERLYDTISFLTTFVCSTFFFSFPAWVEKGALALGTACFGLIAVLIILLRFGDHVKSWLARAPVPAAWTHRVGDMTDKFAAGVSGMTKASSVIGTLTLSLLIWIIEGTVLYVIAHAFGLPLRYPAAFFLLFFMGLSVTLPQAPGYVGTMELFGVTALSALGVPKEQGLPVILAIHAFQFVFILILGIWALGKEGLSVHKLIEREEEGFTTEN
jgi:glycosyltransferase 2 family protein